MHAANLPNRPRPLKQEECHKIGRVNKSVLFCVALILIDVIFPFSEILP